MCLRIEAIPDKCIGRNLHSNGILPQWKWAEISRIVRCGGRCRCCSKWFGYDMFGNNSLHAHEVWKFDLKEGCQRLVNIIPVCEKCHKTLHYNFLLSSKAFTAREAFLAKAHYMEVNGCTEMEFETELKEALYQYRLCNRFEGEWKLDISFVVKSGLALYRDISMWELERTAPGSRDYLLPYEDRPVLRFNSIPGECLIDRAYAFVENEASAPCDICGEYPDRLYVFYDLRVRENISEMVLTGTRNICHLCRETIYYGAKKHFKRWRKTTKHYMKINNCSYDQCVQDAKAAKIQIKINRAAQLYVYFRLPFVSAEEFQRQCRYLKTHGASFNRLSKRWYMRPIKGLWNFKNFL